MNADLKDARILIVDDQTANIDVLEGLLMMQGYTDFKSTTDPRDVEDLLRTYKPELLLLDLMMPHITGFEVMDLIEANKAEFGFIPILILTADVSTGTKQRALAGGASDFLTKPFDLVEVGLRIKNLLYTVYVVSQLADQNILLEEKVVERTSELVLVNQELTRANQKAEEMNKLKSFFLSNVSHEFRTPLVSILGFCEIMLSELNDPDHLRNISFINKSAQRLQRTLNDVLAMVDIERKKLEASFEKTGLKSFTDKLAPEYQKRAQTSGLSFDLKFEGHDIRIFTDPGLLKSIIDNIFDNAVKFTRKGGVTIDVAQKNFDGVPYACIEVSDTGIGIAPDILTTIFAPFRQVSEGMGRSFEGMGLGLSVAKQLAEVLNGDITIASEEGKGTTLTIKVPVVETEQEMSDRINIAKSHVVESEIPAESGKPRLLLVEDNEGNRMIFKKILSKEYIVEEATDGVTALAMAEVNKYDLILMDINLGPGIDGIETFRRIRQMPDHSEIPVVAVTAYGLNEDRKRFLDYGFTDFHPKPIVRLEFLAMIKKLINKNQAS